MALTTIQITGTVVSPDGAPLVSGYITAELSQPGSAMDGAVSVRIVGKIQATITNGAIGADFKLVPNASITPAGTYYKVEISGITADGTSYGSVPPEKWQLAASPASVDIGAVPRLDVVPGVALGLPLATTSVPGAVQLAGDLGGTAAVPVIQLPAYTTATRPAAGAGVVGRTIYVKDPGAAGQKQFCRQLADGSYEWSIEVW